VELITELLACEEEERRIQAKMLRFVGEAERRGAAKSLGYKDTAALLKETLRISAREATSRSAHALATTPSTSVTGTPQPPPLPAAAQALADGALNREHLQVLITLFEACPPEIDPGHRAADETALVTLARQAGPGSLRTAGRRLVSYWDEYRTPPDERKRRELHPQRRLDIAHRRDGSAKFSGELDPETTAVLDGLLGPLAKPRTDPETGGPDPRSTAERHGDALADIIALAARSDDLTVQGGERAVLIVTVTLAELEGRITDALLTVPGATSLDTVRRFACEAKVVPAIFGNDGQPLHLGRTARLATPAQRHALTLRDRGCAFPGCDRRPKWCEVHHITPWYQGGRTDLEDLALVCPAHHRLLHHSDWRILVRNGIPEFLPPPWLDPGRTPQRNHVHDPRPPRRRPAHRPEFRRGQNPWKEAEPAKTEPAR
jgi:hypothetical protein